MASSVPSDVFHLMTPRRGRTALRMPRRGRALLLAPRRGRVLWFALATSVLCVSLAGTAHAAPALTPSVVGEVPQGHGVFRFPQAVAVTAGGSRVYVADQFSSIVQAFDGQGNFLFTIGSRATREEAGRFGVIGGLAVDRSGHLYVLDSENERVQVVSAANGAFIGSFGDATSLNLMTSPASLGGGIAAGGISVFQAAPAASPVVFIADHGNDRVAKYTLDPATLVPVGAPQLSGPDADLQAPQGLAIDVSGTRLFVADDQHHRVVVLNAQTLGIIAATGSFGTGPGQLQFPYDVAVDASSPARLYVADNLNGRVQIFDATTLAFVGTYGSIGYGPGVGNLEIVRATGALADAPGVGVYVADTANNRIQAFGEGGLVTAAFGLAGRGPGYVTRPRGVAFSPDGGVAIADTFDQRIALFASDGTYVDQRGLTSASVGYAVPGDAAGQFNLPAAIAYDPAGNLWIADTGNDRVVLEAPGGAVLATSPAGALGSPRALAPSPAGMYVADFASGLVSNMATDGSLTVVRTGLTHPTALAIAPGGTPLVAEDHAIRDALTGTTIDGPEAATWDHPAGLAFDAAGTLYVSERRPATDSGARILRGMPDGSGGYTWDTIATEGDGPAQVIEPAGLAVTPAGTTLLVADTGNNRVLRFDAPGSAAPVTRALNVAINDRARGTVTSDLPGIACVTDCSQHYGGGRAVTLTAKPKAGSIFSGWGGDCAAAGGATSCTLPMSADRSALARFAPVPVIAPKPVIVPLTFTSVRIKPSRLHLARRPTPAHRHGQKAARAKVRVALNRQGKLTVKVLRAAPGRRAGTKCRAVTKANRGRKHCTRYVALKGKHTITTAKTGRATFTLTPLWAGHQLRRGDYRLSLTAVDAGGLRAAAVHRSFRVVR